MSFCLRPNVCKKCGKPLTLFEGWTCLECEKKEQEPRDDAISRPTVVKFEGTNMACMGGDEIMKEFENNTQQNNDKAISLERAKKQIGRWIGYIDQDMINRICMSLDALPPVTQKLGQWIDSSNGWMCSVCNKDNTYDTNFCPNCGADMRGKNK